MFINSIRRFPSMVFRGLLRERTVPPVAEKLSASKSTNIVASPAIPSNFACCRASGSQKMYLSVNLPRDVQSRLYRVYVARLCTAGTARWDRRLSRFGTKKFGKRGNLETATRTFSNDTRQYHRGLKRGYYKSHERHCVQDVRLLIFNKR